MNHMLSLPAELLFAVEWTFGVLVLLTLLTKALHLLRSAAWRDTLALCQRGLMTVGRAVASATRSPIRHPRAELVAMTTFSAISYSQAIILVVFVLAVALQAVVSDVLPPWKYITILAMNAVIILVAALAFAEGERARQRAHALRKEW